VKGVPKGYRKGINSLIILVSWEIWKHRNDYVFNGASPSIPVLLQTITDECILWCAAKGLQELLAKALAGGH